MRGWCCLAGRRCRFCGKMMSPLREDDVHGGKMMSLLRKDDVAYAEIQMMFLSGWKSFFFLFCVERIPFPVKGTTGLPDFLEADSSLWRRDVFPGSKLFVMGVRCVPSRRDDASPASEQCLPLVETMRPLRRFFLGGSCLLSSRLDVDKGCSVGRRQCLSHMEAMRGRKCIPASWEWWPVEGETRSPLIERRETMFGETWCVQVFTWCFGVLKERMSPSSGRDDVSQVISLQVDVGVISLDKSPLTFVLLFIHVSRPLFSSFLHSSHPCSAPNANHTPTQYFAITQTCGSWKSCNQLLHRARSRSPCLAKAYINRLTFASVPLEQYCAWSASWPNQVLGHLSCPGRNKPVPPNFFCRIYCLYTFLIVSWKKIGWFLLPCPWRPPK